eukprot:8201991-Prorocentrum_lima.AAC.1
MAGLHVAGVDWSPHVHHLPDRVCAWTVGKHRTLHSEKNGRAVKGVEGAAHHLPAGPYQGLRPGPTHSGVCSNGATKHTW